MKLKFCLYVLPYLQHGIAPCAMLFHNGSNKSPHCLRLLRSCAHKTLLRILQEWRWCWSTRGAQHWGGRVCRSQGAHILTWGIHCTGAAVSLQVHPPLWAGVSTHETCVRPHPQLVNNRALRPAGISNRQLPAPDHRASPAKQSRRSNGLSVWHLLFNVVSAYTWRYFRCAVEILLACVVLPSHSLLLLVDYMQDVVLTVQLHWFAHSYSGHQDFWNGFRKHLLKGPVCQLNPVQIYFCSQLSQKQSSQWALYLHL